MLNREVKRTEIILQPKFQPRRRLAQNSNPAPTERKLDAMPLEPIVFGKFMWKL